ncbi:MAG: glycosyltransferase family 4 protein [Proteobacteria bacterium]|nr:glycosyltransferase family 4 protein [Pseudomonadota bacterium]
MKIGYLVPEFPGQTHAFFWRELRQLRQLGVDAELVSTRPPAAGLVSHDWSSEAISQTSYLTQVSLADVADSTMALLRTGLRGTLSALETGAAEAHGPRARARHLTLAGFGARLGAIAARRRWRHIHVHSAADAANVALYAWLLSGLPYSLTLHGPVSDYGPNQQRKWTHASFGIVITQQLHDQLREQVGDHTPLAIAPMGIDPDHFKRRAPYAPHRGESSLRLFSCGRLNPCKGHAHSIVALSKLRQAGVAARLVIAGEDDSGGHGYRQELERLVAELGQQDAVELLGAVPEARVIEELHNAHVFVLASVAEPLGVVLMEALAMEVPVVATRAGGVVELVRDGSNGLLVEPNSDRSITDALLRLASEPELCTRLSRQGRQDIVDNYTSGRSAQLLAEMIGKFSGQQTEPHAPSATQWQTDTPASSRPDPR